MQSPFHQITCWTGATPLYKLGLKLYLGYDGAPCLLTVEVSHISMIKALLSSIVVAGY
jgi:hypothetical protein